MEKVSQAKWEGKVSAKLSNATVDQIWPLFTNFFNFHKWFPSLSICHGVHGTNGDPGCVRYCSGFSIPSNGADKPISWSKERLVAVDHAQHVLSYEIVDSNIGFESYVSTVKIVPEGDRGGDHQCGCVIEWSFTVDPVEGWALDDLVRKYEVGLQRMAQRMEASLANLDVKSSNVSTCFTSSVNCRKLTLSMSKPCALQTRFLLRRIQNDTKMSVNCIHGSQIESSKTLLPSSIAFKEDDLVRNDRILISRWLKTSPPLSVALEEDDVHLW